MKRLFVSLLAVSTVAVAVGVTQLGTTAAASSSRTSIRTIHRTARLGALRTRARRVNRNAGGASLSLRQRNQLNKKFVKSESEGPEFEPNRSVGTGARVVGAKAASPLKVTSKFAGINALDNENVNVLDFEPPDQALCVGNGKVVEVVNDVIGVYDTTGSPLVPPLDLNTFYGYPPLLDLDTGAWGPEPTDPACIYDPATNRFYVTILTLEVTEDAGNLTGVNHLDIAVSDTGNPLGAWNVYSIDATDDGTNGTPDHNCDPADPDVVPPDATNPNSCLGDYPQIGLDAKGLYITTNEYRTWDAFYNPDVEHFAFHGAQVYALPTSALSSGAGDVPLVQIDTVGMVQGVWPGFTLKPANAPWNGASAERGGTMYFMSSNAAGEVSDTPSSNDLIVWSLSHTESLDSSQGVVLRHKRVAVSTYGPPPRQNQKPGPIPLGECVNDTEVETSAGPGCWRFLLDDEPPHDMVEGNPDALDSRVMTAWYSDGTLYGALDTGVRFLSPGESEPKAGVEWFVVDAQTGGKRLLVRLVRQGVLAVRDNNLSMPAIAVTKGGDGVMGMTLMGDDYYPSAVWTDFDRGGPGAVHVAGKGLGPDDGFGAYPPLFGGEEEITRWGDYGAATVSGSALWIANEWIGQTCTFEEWLDDVTCGGTRTPFENWDTHITRLRAT